VIHQKAAVMLTRFSAAVTMPARNTRPALATSSSSLRTGVTSSVSSVPSSRSLVVALTAGKNAPNTP
jgi:hypothetical protein